MKELKSHGLLILFVGYFSSIIVLWSSCVTSLSTVDVQPVADDLEDDYNYEPRYYYNMKRSYIYPQSDVERFSYAPELESDDKRDSIKGPSIDPLVDDGEEVNDEDEFNDQQPISIRKSFYDLKPQAEVTENGRRFSNIENGPEKSKDTSEKKKEPYMKISKKEKEAISEGLIKLLYDWKLQEDKEKNSSAVREQIENKTMSKSTVKKKHQKAGKSIAHEMDKFVGSGLGYSETSGENPDTKQENKQGELDSELHDPLKESKQFGNEVKLGNQEKENAVDKPETEPYDAGSGEEEKKQKKKKTQGKINVMVNVNINERSLRSKVSHANRRRKANDLNTKKGTSQFSVKVEHQEKDEDEDEEEEEEGSSEDSQTKNTNSQAATTISVTSNASNGQSFVPYNNNNTYFNYNINPAVYSNAYPIPAQPQIAPQVSYQAPQQPYQPYQQAYTNNYQMPYSPQPYQTAPNTTTDAKSEGDDENSGEDEDFLEKGIRQEGSADDGSGHEETKSREPKPEKSHSAQNEDRETQIYLPGTMQTVTETHESKPEKQKEDEDEELSENKQHGSKDEKEEQTEETTAEQVTKFKPIEKQTHKIKHRKVHRDKHKTLKVLHQDGEYYMSEQSDTSVHTERTRKHKSNPYKVTKGSDKAGKVNRPAEATKSKAVTYDQAVDVKKMEGPASKEDKSDLMQDSEKKDDKVHLVKLHDSEIRLLKAEKAKIDSSEPIAIDDIKRKHLKPKPIPKEATVANVTNEHLAKITAFHKEENNELKNIEPLTERWANNKPTTKQHFVTYSKETAKPEKVVPPGSEAIKKDDKKEKEEIKGGDDSIKPTGKSNSTEPAVKEKSNHLGLGSKDLKKYGSLKSVRERFKEWEKEMIAKLANPYLKDDSEQSEESAVEAKDGTNQTSAFDSWKDEEDVLINRLANPYLHNGKKTKNHKEEWSNETENKPDLVKQQKQGKEEQGKNKEDSQENNESKEAEKKKNHDQSSKEQTKNVDTAKTGLKEEAQQSTAKPQDKVEQRPELAAEQESKPGPANLTAQSNALQSFVPEDLKSEDSKTKLEEKTSSLNQLQKFKTQILAEVKKIDKLQDDYKKNLKESSELEAAKTTLNKDLDSIREIEKKMANQLQKPNEEKSSKAKSNGKELKTAVIPDPLKKTNASKDDPLLKIQSLLQAEMSRTKKNKKKKGHDKQLENIRGLLKKELVRLIDSGKLGSPNNLPVGLRKLGKMIHKKLKAAKKKKWKPKKLKKQKENPKVSGKELKNSFDLMKEYKPTVAGSVKGVITTMSSYKAAMQALETLKEQQRLAGSNPDETGNTTSQNHMTTKSSAPSSAHTPTKPHVVMPAKLPTGPQTEQFKTLLQNLNKKIGEVYSRLQGSEKQQQQGNPQQQSNNNGQQQSNSNGQQQQNRNTQQQQPHDNSQQQQQQQQYSNAQQQSNNLQQQINTNGQNNAFVPQHGNNFALPQMQQSNPEQNVYTAPEAKHETPDVEEADEPEPDTVMAESEPVESLIENLEKDITDIWSYKDSYPNAESLGLDNDKIHRTYANLGSLSGLSLRRTLDRALRGKDVGLAIVGGSISKGGPFSEKGVDYAIKAYFYAIADWWNKVIRPITGSSMIIRDVSVGGIATDYYAYCLRTHLPNDKLTNIVLWELSANDMRRYDDTVKPRQQSLEQFTQTVLSYKAKPALIYLNFFALFAWDQDLLKHCRNFEDEGENEIAKHYKITSLSWRDMVCSLMQDNTPLFTRDELFAEDQFHPSIEAHAQMAYVIIDYIRTEFLKNLVKQRFLEIGDAARRLKVPDTIYVPKPIFKETFTWKPLCYTYMMVDNQQPNNTLTIEQDVNGDFRYTVLREFKVRSDKIVGMDTKKGDQYITYNIRVPSHPDGDTKPYKKLAIMSFTDDRQAEVRYDNTQVQRIDTTKKFLEGTVLKYVADNVAPGQHKLMIRSGPGGFFVSAIMLG